jgi:hypothetical protein
MRPKLLILLLGSSILLVLGLATSGALARGPETCSGTLESPGELSGTYGNVVVSGACQNTGAVTIEGNLTLAGGAVFAGFGPPVHVTGNIKVGTGAQLLLGWNAAEGELGPDVVDGNIVATQPLSLYIGNVTVRGNVVSNGGGSADRFYNFPIKDNAIGGNLIVHGWTGGWWGVIANNVGGNVDLSNNRSVVHPATEDCEGTFPMGCDAAPGVDDDSSEVQSRIGNPQHISGNLICHGNTPAAQVNPLDGGAPNIVGGRALGECANLGG